MKLIKLRDAHSQFQRYLHEKNHSAATVLAYGKDIDQLVLFLEELKKEHINDVSRENIEAFLAKMSKQGYTPKSISRKINSTRTFYRFLKINEYITDDPSLLIAHPKYDLAPPRILTPMEYRALRDAARNNLRIAAIIELLLQTGIRIGELGNLRLDDLQKNTFKIRTLEKHSERLVPLNKRCLEALNKYISIRPQTKNDRLFVTKSGKPFLIRNVRTAIERYFRLAEIKNAKVNDLRHTFVAHHLKHGVSIVILSKILGHKRLSTTERYLRFIDKNSDVKNANALTEL